jgi:transcriptional regulator of acetoin/glycerol metabolism
VVVGKARQILPEDLPIVCRATVAAARATTLEEVEKAHILQILSDHHWNVARSARVLGIDRSTLYSKIKRYSLQKNA